MVLIQYNFMRWLKLAHYRGIAQKGRCENYNMGDPDCI